METNWNREVGGITEHEGGVFVNVGKDVPLVRCIGKDERGVQCSTLGIPSVAAHPEWGFLCNFCANAPARKGSRNSTGYSALTPQTVE